MNIEYNRLKSFDDVTKKSNLRKARFKDGKCIKSLYKILIKQENYIELLYKSGFYYDKDRDIICCCGCACELFIYGNKDHINFKKEINLLHSKSCQYVKNINGSKIFLDFKASLYYERERLNSFIDYPFFYNDKEIGPINLAKNGYFYARHDDYCICIFCLKSFKTQNPDFTIFHNCSQDTRDFNISLNISNILDNLVMENEHFPLPLLNFPKPEKKDDDNFWNDTEISLKSFHSPMFPKYINEETRLATYKDDWKFTEKQIHQSSKNLAKAGFMCLGKFDYIIIIFVVIIYNFFPTDV